MGDKFDYRMALKHLQATAHQWHSNFPHFSGLLTVFIRQWTVVIHHEIDVAFIDFTSANVI